MLQYTASADACRNDIATCREIVRYLLGTHQSTFDPYAHAYVHSFPALNLGSVQRGFTASEKLSQAVLATGLRLLYDDRKVAHHSFFRPPARFKHWMSWAHQEGFHSTFSAVISPISMPSCHRCPDGSSALLAHSLCCNDKNSTLASHNLIHDGTQVV